MPLVWCSISGHGFGHAAQLVPVLNELGRRISNLRVLLRTTVPPTFFHETLHIPWEHSFSQQDIGCIQDGPLSIDVSKTWKAYEEFHVGWKIRVTEEVKAIRAATPALVLSNISHLGIASGVSAGYPTVALASLSWDQVLAEYVTPGHFEQEKIVEHIRQVYQGAQVLIRPFPGIPMSAFTNVLDVGPVLSAPISSDGALRSRLHMKAEERVVLVAFGGIPLSSLPLEQLESMEGYRFLISGNIECHGYTRIVSTNRIGLSFRQMLAEADLVITKPGYATITEAVRLRMPVVYVRRYNFVDEQPLVDFAHQYGQAAELSLQDFQSGQWLQVLEHVQSLPSSHEPMPQEGTEAAVDHLLEILG